MNNQEWGVETFLRAYREGLIDADTLYEKLTGLGMSPEEADEVVRIEVEK